MTLQEIRDYARTHADVDDTDVPNLLIDRWIVDGYRRIIRSRKRWEHLEANKTLTLVAGTQSYDVPTKTDSILAVYFAGRSISYASHQEMTKAFQNSTNRSDPLFWSQWGTKLYFWPTPQTGGSADIQAIRQPDFDWLNSPSGLPDLPDDYQSPLLAWVLSETYKHANDFFAAGNFAQDFVSILNELNMSENDDPLYTPKILNGGTSIGGRFAHAYDVRENFV